MWRLNWEVFSQAPVHRATRRRFNLAVAVADLAAVAAALVVGGFNPFAAAAAGGAGNNSQQRIQKATQVTAVADSRIQAVIVTAPKDLMEEIAGMMADLDVPSDRDQGVYVFQMMNGDPQQAVQVLQNMFQSSSTSRSGSSSSSSQNSALQQRAQNSTTTMGTTTTTSGIGGTGAGGIGGAGGRTSF